MPIPKVSVLERVDCITVFNLYLFIQSPRLDYIIHKQWELKGITVNVIKIYKNYKIIRKIHEHYLINHSVKNE